MSPNLTMAEAADLVGLSYERFRKVWQDLARDENLPRPFRGRTWDRQALEQWRVTRSWRASHAPAATPPAGAAPASPPSARRDRAQLQALRQA